MKYPDIYSHCIRIDGSVDLERLKVLSREQQVEYESYQSRYSVMETALYDILNLTGKVDRKTGVQRDTNWVIERATKAIEDAQNIESRGFIELQKLAQLTQQLNHQPINQI